MDMKSTFIITLAIILLFTPFILSAQEEYSYKPKDGYVPDAVIAIKIAEAVLVPIYGEKVINEEKPLKAVLKDGVWTVEGTLKCPEGEKCFGGVAIIKISKDDGRVLRVSHGK
jgi:hypothetical protein